MSDVVGPRNVSDGQLTPMQRAMGAGGGDGPSFKTKLMMKLIEFLTSNMKEV